MIKHFIVTGIICLCLSSYACASQMVYTPVNPSFGGNPFNGSVLLNEANANNHYVAPTPQTTSTTQSFNDTLNSVIAAQVGSSVATQILTTPNGSYSNTKESIVWTTTNSIKTIITKDLVTGQITPQTIYSP